jgi:hypothetical protein
MRNKYKVGAVGRRVEIGNLPREPELTPDEAIELAVYLVAAAVPLHKEPAGAVLGKFHKGLVDVGSEELGAAAAAELEE